MVWKRKRTSQNGQWEHSQWEESLEDKSVKGKEKDKRRKKNNNCIDLKLMKPYGGSKRLSHDGRHSKVSHLRNILGLGWWNERLETCSA